MRQKIGTKSIILCLLLIGSIYCGIISRSESIQTFKSLKSSQLGKDLYLTLSLELKAGQSEGKVDRILKMLRDLFESLSAQKDQTFTVKSEKSAFCTTKLQELEFTISSYQESIDASALTIPTLQQQQEDFKQLLQTKKSEEGSNQEQLNELNLSDQSARDAFKKTLQEHEDMLEALRQARKTISQLSVQSFLQKNVQVFAQIRDIGKNLRNQIQPHRLGFLDILAELSQDIGVQSDQDQVANIITIIDELMEFEEATMRVEQRAESLRQARYEFDVTRFQESTERLDAQIKDLNAKAVTLNTRVVELNNRQREEKQNQKAKQAQYDLQQQSCSSEILALDKQLEEYNELLDIVRKVINIFQSQTITDIKDYVE